MTEILFYGDPHGQWRPLLRAVEFGLPDAVVLLGDCDLERPLAQELAPLVELGVPVHWIPGNHDSDRAVWFDNLFAGGLEQGNLHGRVVEVAGLRLAGLGGIFRANVWHPAVGTARVHRDAASFRHAVRQRGRPRHVEALLRLARTSLFPDDYDRLADMRADILVTHEAPSCHRHGFMEIDLLAQSIGARLIVHGHHHEDYEAELDGGVQVVGVGKATARRLTFGEDGRWLRSR